MRAHKVISIFAAATWSTVVIGQDILECLSPDLVRSLILPTSTNSAIPVTADMPPELAEVLSPDFEWIGLIKGNIRWNAVFKTGLSRELVWPALQASFEEAGWTVGESTFVNMSPFTFEGQASMAGRVCKNGRSGDVAVRDVNGARYLNLLYAPEASQPACGAPPNRLQQVFSATAIDQMPLLRLPSGTGPAGAPGPNVSGLAPVMRASVQLVSDEPPDALRDLLGRQMTEQGWSLASSWQGRRGAGAVWRREAGTGSRLLGTLEIVTLANDTLEAEFRLTTL